jgi:hypothetical protein
METFTLSHQSPAFTIWGSEERMSAEILKVLLKENSTEEVLILKVTDENGLLLYSKPLISKPTEPFAVQFNEFPEVVINKRFIFSEKLEVSILATHSCNYSVEVQYV